MNFIAPFHALLKCNRVNTWTVKLKQSRTNWFSIIILALFCTACASTQNVVDTNVKIDFPSTTPVETVEQADAVLTAVTLSYAQIEWRYRQMEQICYSKFFMNSCLLEAKKQRRTDLAIVKKSEVAAKFFKRKKTVEEMDKALLEKNIQHPLPENYTEKPSLTP